MRRNPVTSSNIASIGWESGQQSPHLGTMEVEFVRGAVYRYLGVPVSVAFRVAAGEVDGSVGRTFHRLVRSRNYAFERVQ